MANFNSLSELIEIRDEAIAYRNEYYMILISATEEIENLQKKNSDEKLQNLIELKKEYLDLVNGFETIVENTNKQIEKILATNKKFLKDWKKEGF